MMPSTSSTGASAGKTTLPGSTPEHSMRTGKPSDLGTTCTRRAPMRGRKRRVALRSASLRAAPPVNLVREGRPR